MLHFVLIDIIILGEEEGFKLKKGGPSTEGARLMLWGTRRRSQGMKERTEGMLGLVRKVRQ